MTTQKEYLAGSVLVGLVATTVTRLRDRLAATPPGRVATTAERAATDAPASSTLVTGLRKLAHSIRNSFCYRWLTKEPDPDVVVIDLRETYTVGPIVALCDRLAPAVGRAWRGSGASRLTEALRTSSKLEWLADSRTVRLLAAALEPPEPPAENRRD